MEIYPEKQTYGPSMDVPCNYAGRRNMAWDDLQIIFRVLSEEADEQFSTTVLVSSVHNSFEVSHAEIRIWPYLVFKDFILSQKDMRRFIDPIYGIYPDIECYWLRDAIVEFLDNIKNSVRSYEEYVDENDVLTLIAQH